MTYFLFILTGIIISLGFTGLYLFKKKEIQNNLLLIFFGIILGPILHLIEPSGFQNVAPIFSSLVLLFVAANIQNAFLFPDLILIIIIATVAISSLGTALLKRGELSAAEISEEKT